MCCKNKCVKWSIIICLSLITLILIGLFVGAPLAFHWIPSLMRSFIFVPQDEVSNNTDYEHPGTYGFVGRNFYLRTPDNATLGVWHTLPEGLQDQAMNKTEADDGLDEFYDQSLSNATVFLYLHGSAGTRTSPHRLRVYNLLNCIGFHLVTFDYRGYGDSTSYPRGETDLITDTLTVYSWLKQKVHSGNIFIWGHSLGTGVAAHFSATLAKQNESVSGIVLEAPFSNMEDEVRVSKLISMVSFLPWFDYGFIDPLYMYDISFTSDKYLKTTLSPILILHAKDDRIVPYKLAVKLYEEVSECRPDYTSTQIKLYDSDLGYGHYNIALDPTLNITIREFVQTTQPRST